MHLSSCLGLVKTGCATLANSYRQIADGHAHEPDVSECLLSIALDHELIGALAGGGKGAAIGAGVGAGAGTGVAVATGKEEAVIPVEAALTFTTR